MVPVCRRPARFRRLDRRRRDARPGWRSRLGRIGYTLAPAHAGHGFASEAVAAIVDYVFRQRGKHEVMAWTDTRNTSSVALLKRLGFVCDAASRQRTLFKGAWCDEDRYVMTSGNWIAR